MRFRHSATAGLACLLAIACGPAFNWRETPIASTGLVALFPCKPETLTRRLVLAGNDTDVHMSGCDAVGFTVAVGHATLVDRSMAAQAIAQWREATLAGLRTRSTTVSTLPLERALDLPEPVRLQARGSRADGHTLVLQAVWFARDTEVFAALLYGESLPSEVTDSFFSGMRFR